jgi:hypothetical protein
VSVRFDLVAVFDVLYCLWVLRERIREEEQGKLARLSSVS